MALRFGAGRRLGNMARPTNKEADLSGNVVFALLLNKSAIGIYSSHAKAVAAWNAFHDLNSAAGPFAIKPFTLNGPAMIYAPY